MSREDLVNFRGRCEKMALAFLAPGVGLLFSPSTSRFALGKTRLRVRARVVPRRRSCVRAEVGEVGEDVAAPGPGPSMPSIDFDAESLQKKAEEVVTDLRDRPGFYGRILAYVAVGFVGLKVASAIVDAVDKIPLLPQLLELVG